MKGIFTTPRGGAVGFGFRCGAAALFTALVFALALTLTGCRFVLDFLGFGEEDKSPQHMPAPAEAERLLHVAAEGGANTRALTLVFNRAMDGLTADNIEITPAGGNSSITRGNLVHDSGNPFVYTIDVNGITAEGQVSVDVERNGAPIAGSSKTVWVHRGAQLVSFADPVANGAPGAETTTALTLTFGGLGINGLTGNEIDLLPLDTANSGITKGALTGSGTSYRLAVSGVAAEGDVIVSLNKSGYSTAPAYKTVRAHSASAYTVTFNADGGTPASQQRTVNGGASLGDSNKPAVPVKNGYTFGGWWTQKGVEFTTSTAVTGDMTVYAKWAQVFDPSVWQDAGGGKKQATFTYTGNVQAFRLFPNGGTYQFELWGADGGVSNQNITQKGGYASGSIANLPANETLYVYVGGKGADAQDNTAGSGGWNGGGNGGTGKSSGGGGGGGATDVRFVQGALNTRIIVAGGAGGSGGSALTTGGAGGGANGVSGRGFITRNGNYGDAAGGGSQTDNSFGTGATGGDNGGRGGFGNEGKGGGGGGYFGGNAWGTPDMVSGGGGGSGFVYGYSSTGGATQDEYKVPAAYQNYKFTVGWSCIAGNAGIPANPGIGNGYVRITFTPH